MQPSTTGTRTFIIAVGSLTMISLVVAFSWRAARPNALSSQNAFGTTATVVMGATAVVGSEAHPQPFAGVRWIGPTSVDNLDVFVGVADERDDRDFLTLEEGLTSGSVVINEKAQAQVAEVEVENRSDQPLFLQEGERLCGGQQDRIVRTTVVIAPRSGKVAVAVFCVEPGRWTGASPFGLGSNAALAPRTVRLAAKADNDQAAVWRQVASERQLECDKCSCPSSTTSLSETTDSAELKKAQATYVSNLSAVLDAHPDAVAIAFAVNGKIEEVDRYPGRPLLGKLYPKLLACFAVQAFTRRGPGSLPAHATSSDLASFVKEGTEGPAQQQAVNTNTQVIFYTSDRKAQFETQYRGVPVHAQCVGK
jgi:hypothetical protein